MVQNLNVQGSKESSQPLIINHDNVYLHSNIHEVEEDDLDGRKHTSYVYDEIIMTKDEYLMYLQKQIDTTGNAMEELINYVMEDLS